MRDIADWLLNPDVTFLNHGSFGALPRSVFKVYQGLQLEMEMDPIHFLAPERSLLGRLDDVRTRLGSLIGASGENLVFVRNATDGVNAVVQNLPLGKSDQILITNHGYNACNNAARHAAQRSGAEVVVAEIPFPIESSQQVVQAVERAITAKTRLLLIDHVTSPTGLILPIQELVDLCRSNNILSMVDGAHAPGMIPLDLSKLQPDFYTGNHHKWLCGPKASGFLYVRKELQPQVHPTVISHGANTDSYGLSKFHAEFNWIGTYDPTPILTLPASLDFLEASEGGLGGVMSRNRNLAIAGQDILQDYLGIPESKPGDFVGSLAAIPLKSSRIRGASSQSLASLQKRLFEEHKIEVPIFTLVGEPILRVSAQLYNELGDYKRLAEVLKRLL